MALTVTDRRFISEAFALARRESHDPTRAVGSIIVGTTGRIIGAGTNRPPTRLGFERQDSFAAIASDQNWKYYFIEHAEREALNHARDHLQDTQAATMYTTLFPCADCTRAVIAAGIRRLIAPHPAMATSADLKWQTHFEYSTMMLRRAHVELQTYSPAEFVVAAP